MEQQKKHIDSIVSLLYQKGYRGPFTILVPQSGRPMRSGELRRLMEYFLECKKDHNPLAELTTHAPYNHKLWCRMQVAYSATEGFKLRQLYVTNTQTKESRQFHFRHNQELPGSMAIEGLFPHPKPWDQFLKGKGFKP